MGLDQYSREQESLLRCAGQAWQRGLTAGSCGNLSCRVEEGMLITCSGSSFRTLTAEDLLLVDENERIIAGNFHRRPSIETGFHRAIYQARPEAKAIFHIHPLYSCCYACQGRGITPVTEAGRLLLGELATVPSAPPGSTALADAIRQTLADHPAAQALVLIEHGVVTFDRDMDHAYDRAELLEAEAQMDWLLGR